MITDIEVRETDVEVHIERLVEAGIVSEKTTWVDIQEYVENYMMLFEERLRDRVDDLQQSAAMEQTYDSLRGRL